MAANTILKKNKLIFTGAPLGEYLNKLGLFVLLKMKFVSYKCDFCKCVIEPGSTGNIWAKDGVSPGPNSEYLEYDLCETCCSKIVSILKYEAVCKK